MKLSILFYLLFTSLSFAIEVGCPDLTGSWRCNEDSITTLLWDRGVEWPESPEISDVSKKGYITSGWTIAESNRKADEVTYIFGGEGNKQSYTAKIQSNGVLPTQDPTKELISYCYYGRLFMVNLGRTTLTQNEAIIASNPLLSKQIFSRVDETHMRVARYSISTSEELNTLGRSSCVKETEKKE